MRKNPDCIDRLAGAGISYDDAWALRRIAMTLHRWHELECGTDSGAVEREEKWAVERAAWPARDRNRWWDGKSWNVKAERRTYSDHDKPTMVDIPADAAFRETGCKPYWRNAMSGKRWPTPDRETGARKRLDAIMAKYPSLSAYVQGDPRGASLYILRPGDVPEGESADAYYNRGVAVYK